MLLAVTTIPPLRYQINAEVGTTQKRVALRRVYAFLGMVCAQAKLKLACGQD